MASIKYKATNTMIPNLNIGFSTFGRTVKFCNRVFILASVSVCVLATVSVCVGSATIGVSFIGCSLNVLMKIPPAYKHLSTCVIITGILYFFYGVRIETLVLYFLYQLIDKSDNVYYDTNISEKMCLYKLAHSINSAILTFHLNVLYYWYDNKTPVLHELSQSF